MTQPLMTTDLGRSVGGTCGVIVGRLSRLINLGEHSAVAPERNRSRIDQLRFWSAAECRGCLRSWMSSPTMGP
jgi:hypothetical protein